MFGVGLILSVMMALGVVKISHWIYKWRNPKCSSGILPPGSMGFPVIGETIQFMSIYGFYGFSPFIAARISSYGPMFRTSVIGEKTIVTTDPEVNYNIVRQENKGLTFGYPRSIVQMLGKHTLFFKSGMHHKFIRDLILQIVGPNNLKATLLSEIEYTTLVHLNSWAAFGNVDVHEMSVDMLFEFMTKKLIGYEESKYQRKLKDNFKAFAAGFVCIPLSIPGLAYHKSLQARKKTVEILKDLLKEKKTSERQRDDVLDYLLEELEKKDTFLTEEMTLDTLLGLLLAAHETNSRAITLAVMLLTDHPNVLAELKIEHENIIKDRAEKETGITWIEYKSMTFTHMVINELLRLANFAVALFRRATKDIQISGYTIPAGWAVVVASIVHFDSNKYEDPYAFNPWRWKGQDMSMSSKTFTSFGGGTRLCPGADIAKLQLSVFLHHFVTKYRWTITKGDAIRNPGLMFPNGLHINISENHN